jgi:hypothetical protein
VLPSLASHKICNTAPVSSTTRRLVSKCHSGDVVIFLKTAVNKNVVTCDRLAGRWVVCGHAYVTVTSMLVWPMGGCDHSSRHLAHKMPQVICCDTGKAPCGSRHDSSCHLQAAPCPIYSTGVPGNASGLFSLISIIITVIALYYYY